MTDLYLTDDLYVNDLYNRLEDLNSEKNNIENKIKKLEEIIKYSKKISNKREEDIQKISLLIENKGDIHDLEYINYRYILCYLVNHGHRYVFESHCQAWCKLCGETKGELDYSKYGYNYIDDEFLYDD